MASVRSRDTAPELALRRALHARGLRYRVNVRDLPGTPDLAIRKHRLVVFVDGDMWHGNEHRRRGLASLAELFPTNTEFWVQKIERNIERDKRVNEHYRRLGWTVVRIWASEIEGDVDAAANRVLAAIPS